MSGDLTDKSGGLEPKKVYQNFESIKVKDKIFLTLKKEGIEKLLEMADQKKKGDIYILFPSWSFLKNINIKEGPKELTVVIKPVPGSFNKVHFIENLCPFLRDIKIIYC